MPDRARFGHPMCHSVGVGRFRSPIRIFFEENILKIKSIFWFVEQLVNEVYKECIMLLVLGIMLHVASIRCMLYVSCCIIAGFILHVVCCSYYVTSFRF